MATLQFTIHLSGITDNTLVVREFNGVETLSHADSIHGFELNISLASRQDNFTAHDLVDKTAELAIYQNGELSQRFCGVVSHFSRGDSSKHHTFYQLTLVPALARLALRHNCRIFQNLTARDIIATLCNEMGIDDYAFALSRECKQREFCVQYRESDLAFIERLSAEEGMSYSFTHEQGKHTLVFCDNSALLPKHAEPIPYHNQAGGNAPYSYIRTLQLHTQIAPSSVQLQDYSFKQPSYNHAHTAQGKQMQYQGDSYEHFDAPGRYKDANAGKAFTQHRIEYLRREARIASGKSNHATMRAGYRFSLCDHPDSAMNRDWLVIHVQHHGTQPQALEEAATSGQTTYHNEFKLLPANLTWRSDIKAKPLVDGPMIAKVVGPEGEEIHCDQHGRVKVRFNWDRYSQGDENSSCWIRVSQGWAGSQYGFNTLPRIGHEVVVSFLNGDPDQPIVTGRVHNSELKTPYPLPEHKTKTVLRSQTHQGKGFNELSFEDQADSEKIYLHAQKDLETKIQNDIINDIGHDQHILIGHDQFNHIQQNQHHTVDGHSHIKVAQDSSHIVEGSMHAYGGKQHICEVGTSVNLGAGSQCVVEAGSSVTFKVGTNFIKLDCAGVHVNAAQLVVDQGGQALTVENFAGKLPDLPLGLKALEAPDPVTPLLYQAILSGEALSLLCQQQADGSCPLTDCPCKRNKP